MQELWIRLIVQLLWHLSFIGSSLFLIAVISEIAFHKLYYSPKSQYIFNAMINFISITSFLIFLAGVLVALFENQSYFLLFHAIMMIVNFIFSAKVYKETLKK